MKGCEDLAEILLPARPADFAIAAVKIPFQPVSERSGRRKRGVPLLASVLQAASSPKKARRALLLRPHSAFYGSAALRAAQITRSGVIPAAVPLALACGARAGEKLLCAVERSARDRRRSADAVSTVIDEVRSTAADAAATLSKDRGSTRAPPRLLET